MRRRDLLLGLGALTALPSLPAPAAVAEFRGWAVKVKNGYTPSRGESLTVTVKHDRPMQQVVLGLGPRRPYPAS